MDIEAVMDEIAAVLKPIPGLQVHPHPVNMLATVPAAEVLFPDIEYDQSFQKGLVRLDGGIIVSVGRVFDQAARENLTKYADPSDSPHSIHHAIRTRTRDRAWTSCDYAQVTRGYGTDHTVNEVTYVAYRFDLDIYGSGT